MMFKKIINNTLLFFISISITVLVLDVIINNYFIVRPSSYLVTPGYYEPDEITGHDIKPSVKRARFQNYDGIDFDIWSNNIGCFDIPLQNTSDYILVLGDSFSWGYTDFGTRWSDLLRSRTRRDVLNCAVAGTGTRVQFDKMKKIINKIKKPPKLIIVGYFLGNDITDDYLYPQRTVIQGYKVNQRLLSIDDGSIIVKSREELSDKIISKLRADKIRQDYAKATYVRKIKKWLSDHSGIYFLLRKNTSLRRLFGVDETAEQDADTRSSPGSRLKHSYQPLVYASNIPWIQGAWKKHLENIDLFRQYSNLHNIPVLFVLIPTREQVYKYHRKDTSLDYLKPINMVTEYMASKNIAFIDMHKESLKLIGERHSAKQYQDEDHFYRLDPHWNRNGHAFAARIISEYIEKNSIGINKQ